MPLPSFLQISRSQIFSSFLNDIFWKMSSVLLVISVMVRDWFVRLADLNRSFHSPDILKGEVPSSVCSWL